MQKAKPIRIISIVIYFAGVAAVLCLTALFVFGSAIVPNPDAMLPMTLRDMSALWLAVGSLPMFLASIVFYNLNNIKNSAHKKRNSFFVFLPSLICVGFAATLIFIILRSF